MGCGSSGHVIAPAPAQENGSVANGHTVNEHNTHHDNDLPTVMLPDTPAKPKPPIAFEIPIKEFDSSHREITPPAHLQRLLRPPSTDISLPHIEEKLAEAEQRRQAILQQRAASAQKRSQKMTKSFQDIKKFDKTEFNHDETSHKLIIPPDPGHEDKLI
ncbi:uncharacterized protein LOC125062122 [Pieris napi]|uniref:uncharacterized protein LOC125062122 n=1 Tax=Pieris napi TaxID=78633 RepID=UPI001FBB7911|nr:uncharacterized protein LOC125062122 [Pieris napi]